MERRDFLKNLFKVAAYSQIAGLADTLQEDVDTDKRSGKGVQITRRPYRQTGMTLPLLGFGMMRLPGKDGKINLDDASAMVARALEHGCNHFDTAYVYPGSEEFIGRVLSKYPRDSYYLTSKMPIRMLKSEDDLERIFQEQRTAPFHRYADGHCAHWGCHAWPSGYVRCPYACSSRRRGASIPG